jgi:hypothetical protein
MSDESRDEVKRGEHRVPRWISVLWLALVGCMVLTSIGIAVRWGDDFVGTVGLVVVSAIPIFAVSAVVYVVLYGFSILLEGIDYHKANCDDSKHFAGMMDFMR